VFGASYLALVLCIGEIFCALPFNGGAFGIVRSTIGLFPGYLSGFGEAAYYIIFGSTNVVCLATLISEHLSIQPIYSPILWVALYIVSCMINAQNKSSFFFWRFVNGIAIICLGLVLLYFFGTVSNLKHHAVLRGRNFVEVDSFHIFQYFPWTAWFYIGIESLPLAFNKDLLSRETIAFGSLMCLLTLFVINFMVMCLTFFLFENPSILASQRFPLNEGYVSFLGCTTSQASWLAVPSLFGGLVGFTFSHGKLICALSESRLLPLFLEKKTAANCPYAAVVFGCLIGYCICWLMHFFPQTMGNALSQCSFIAAFITYGSYCAAYIVLKRQYLRSIVYTYQSPFGTFGAAFVILVFICGTISLIFFQEAVPWGFVILVGLLFVASVYYFVVVRSKQIFSEEEQRCVSLASGPAVHHQARKKKDNRIFAGGDQAQRDGRLSPVGMICTMRPPKPEPKSDQGILELKHVSSRASSIYYGRGSRQHVAGIRNMLMDKDRAKELRANAELKFCAENVDFCSKAFLYKQAAEEILSEGTLYANLALLHTRFILIVREYIAVGSPNEINISWKQKADILRAQDFKVFSTLHPLKMATILDEAVVEVEMILRDNVLR